FTYDNHDYSLRCVQQGYENFVFSMRYFSEVKWGGMRNNPNPNTQNILKRNNNYIYKNYRDFLVEEQQKLKSSNEREDLIPNLAVNESDKEALRLYRRAKDRLDVYSGLSFTKRFVNRAKRAIKEVTQGIEK